MAVFIQFLSFRPELHFHKSIRVCIKFKIGSSLFQQSPLFFAPGEVVFHILEGWLDRLASFSILVWIDQRRWTCAKKSLNMCWNTLSERWNRPWLGRVATLQNWHKTAVAALVGNFYQLLGHPFVVKFVDCCVGIMMNVILLMRIKTGRYQYKIGVELNQLWYHLRCKCFPPSLWCRGTWEDG